MAVVDQSGVKKCNCDVMTVLIHQYKMDYWIKIEPGLDAEACSETKLVEFEQEEQLLPISLPLPEESNDVSC